MEWTFEIPNQKGWYWLKEEHGKAGVIYLDDIIYFDGVHFNPGNEYNECGPGDVLFEELYGDVQWYGPIEPPK